MATEPKETEVNSARRTLNPKADLPYSQVQQAQLAPLTKSKASYSQQKDTPGSKNKAMVHTLSPRRKVKPEKHINSVSSKSVQKRNILANVKTRKLSTRVTRDLNQ
jgi:hypothetical protein